MATFHTTDSATRKAYPAPEANVRRTLKGKAAASKPLSDAPDALHDEERYRGMQALVQLGEERGYLTHAEINDYLQDDVAQSAMMEALVSKLGEMGVAVHERAPEDETLDLNSAAPAAVVPDEPDEEAEVAPGASDADHGDTADPMRMYMRELSATGLLSRADEVEAAKLIEGGRQALMQVIVACPATVAAILSSAQQIAEGQLDIQELVHGLHADDSEVQLPTSNGPRFYETSDDASRDHEREIDAVDLEKINEARLSRLKSDSLRIFARVSDLFQYTQRPDVLTPDSPVLATDACDAILLELAQIRFTARTIERLCADVHQQINQVHAAERRIFHIAIDRCGMRRERFIDLFKGHETDLGWTEKTAMAWPEIGAALQRSAPAIQAEQRKLMDVELDNN
jgi:RNA polymerase primary sigma factor